jgi:hypothetical protein
MRPRYLVRFSSIVMIGALVTACGTPKTARDAGSQPSELAATLASARPEYNNGSEVSLSVIVTNHQGQPCQILRVPDGALSIVTMTRSGTPIAPTLTFSDYVDGFASYLTANVGVLAPGESFTIPWSAQNNTVTQNKAALRTAGLYAHDQSSDTLWPVDASGSYALTARYVLPQSLPALSNPCHTSVTPTSLNFTIKP